MRNPELTRCPAAGTEVTDPAKLLLAADQGAVHVRLADELERLVARALESQDRRLLRAASLALRVWERSARTAGRPVPPRVTKLLGDVRAAMRATREAP